MNKKYIELEKKPIKQYVCETLHFSNYIHVQQTKRKNHSKIKIKINVAFQFIENLLLIEKINC